MEQKEEYAVGSTAFSAAAERPRARITCPSRWISALSASARRAPGQTATFQPPLSVISYSVVPLSALRRVRRHAMLCRFINGA